MSYIIKNFSERKTSNETTLNPNFRDIDSYKNKRIHPVLKVVDIILSKKYNMGPLEKETLPEKTSVFSYNSAFKPIINRSLLNKSNEFKDGGNNLDLNLNSSFEKLNSKNKRKFLLSESLNFNSSNYNFFKLDNTILKPKAIKFWGNNDEDETKLFEDSAKRMISKKRNRYDNDDYAKYSPDYDRNYRNKSMNDYNYNFTTTNRTNRQNKNLRDFDSEENSKFNFLFFINIILIMLYICLILFSILFLFFLTYFLFKNRKKL